MQESNNLTEKEFWSSGWRNISLPARFFYANYSRIVITNLIEKHIENMGYKNFLEIGGCPGRWADYFFTRHRVVSDSMDYTEANISLTRKNYELLGIDGQVFLDDITNPKTSEERKYDIVLSDGLVEHFVDSDEVFKNHTKFLKKDGLLIIGVPNIKKSWFYDYFAKKDEVGYAGYRHLEKEELILCAKKNKLQVLFCDYVGVFNIGLVHSFALGFVVAKLFVVTDFFAGLFLRIFNVKKESKTLSPYIYLIAKKHE